MYLPKLKEDIAMRWNEITTMENLVEDGCTQHGAVLKYGDKVLVCGLTYRGFEVAIYEFVETPEETGFFDVECRIQLLEKCETIFDDGGHAMKWCFERA